MLPIGIAGKRKFKPNMTIALILINIAVFIWELSVSSQGTTALMAMFKTYALDVCKVGVEPLPNIFLDNLRSMFLHGSMGHLFGNMLFLWVFGRRVEEYFGSSRYLMFYLVVGSIASLSHIIFGGIVCSLPTQTAIVVGASGAIAGVMGAFLFLYPGARVDAIIGFFRPLFWRAKVPAFLFLIYWFVMDFLQGIGWIASFGVAHWAHIGGFVGGLAIAFIATLFVPAPAQDPFEYLDD